MNRGRILLSIRGVLVGYSFEPRPKSRALATARLVYDCRLINKRKLALKKKLFDERKQD